jgi:hypothetical protein
MHDVFASRRFPSVASFGRFWLDTKNHPPGDRWKSNGPASFASWRLREKLKNLVMTENAIAKEIVDASFRMTAKSKKSPESNQ